MLNTSRKILNVSHINTEVATQRGNEPSIELALAHKNSMVFQNVWQYKNHPKNTPYLEREILSSGEISL
ncbi:hypothetical protein [Acetobacter malorum]|uniref:hypothetical protein n=1 Tax=Acetobacter malorum TaxID=178901 RepID=UPI002230E6EE|nr:hypothetical protein [Acetobacter malorum]